MGEESTHRHRSGSNERETQRMRGGWEREGEKLYPETKRERHIEGGGRERERSTHTPRTNPYPHPLRDSHGDRESWRRETDRQTDRHTHAHTDSKRDEGRWRRQGGEGWRDGERDTDLLTCRQKS